MESSMEEKKYALVTGADHGLGLALVTQLLERGFHVIAGQNNAAETYLNELQEKNPGTLDIVSLDIGSDESVAFLKTYVTENYPKLDLIVNNAGILGNIDKVLGDNLDFDEMLRVINVNALGALRVVNALCGHLLKSELKLVVTISSEAGSIADCYREGWFAYGMSKAANNMQSATVHNNLKKQGGRVLVFHPGHVATYMRGHLDTDAKLTPMESASHILTQSLDREIPVTESPMFIDDTGAPMNW